MVPPKHRTNGDREASHRKSGRRFVSDSQKRQRQGGLRSLHHVSASLSPHVSPLLHSVAKNIQLRFALIEVYCVHTVHVYTYIPCMYVCFAYHVFTYSGLLLLGVPQRNMV